MRGALKILLPLIALGLAGCVTTPKYTKEEISDLRLQLTQCMSTLSKMGARPGEQLAIVSIDLAKGGVIKHAVVSYRSKSTDASLGVLAMLLIRKCSPLKTRIEGPVHVPVALVSKKEK